MTLETVVEGIGHLLSDRLLAIPDYQRSYSWADDAVRDLWRDLRDAMDDGMPEYFLGSVVTTNDDGAFRHQVIDGQQRLASVSLLYAALRDILQERADERAGEIERKVLGEKDIITRQLQPRLVLNAEDNALFRQLVLVPAAERQLEATQESHRRLLGAFEFFSTELRKLAADAGEHWATPLLSLYQYIFEKAKIINVSVQEENRAFVIFETLNDRGLNLSTADLLKNYLFGQAEGDRFEEAKLRWTGMIASLPSEGDTDAFLRQYWSSQKGVVRVKALYSQIKPTVQGSDSSLQFIEDLAKAAPVWAAIFDRDAEQWHELPSGALGALDTLRGLNVEQCRPLLLAAARNFEASDMKDLLASVVAWSIRWFVVGGGSGGVVERLYARTARDVSEGVIADLAGVREAFKDQVPRDSEFSTSFESLTVRRGWLARYYLSALERAANGANEPELVPNQDVDEVNLEHVLPRNATADEWPAFTADERISMRLLLGNQALLRKSHNSQIGNKSFDIKKPVLAASSLSLTKMIGEKDQWTPIEVLERQHYLASLAPKVWPGPEHS